MSFDIRKVVNNLGVMIYTTILDPPNEDKSFGIGVEKQIVVWIIDNVFKYLQKSRMRKIFFETANPCKVLILLAILLFQIIKPTPLSNGL